ncbi:formylglycine-generating enzyme family protein [Methanolobus sp.]|jgi:formylglycine-generating enzyme required for sulfatase activity|uniref:formylglycine-generating enzyme family protein n=1 Tax=Methanolobus sp. TaxID=1874737 RepID=UPI0025F2799F|nr:formylglycine-generating enzyme family protein [Methanolobus sp.]
MNKRLYLTFIICIILAVTVIGSGCTDSDDTGIDEESEEPADVQSVPEETEVDDGTFTNSIGMEFVKIPAGEFIMGAPEEELYSDKDERPVHEVTIADEFYIGVYEVTQKQWEAVMGDNPSNFVGDDLPVERVSWADVNIFVDKLNEMENTDSYRLPTEAEWEYVAKAGTETAFSYGDDESMLADYGWYDDNSEDKTRPVGMKQANPWGLYDIHGNVAEWVLDEYHSNYQKAPTDGSEWTNGVNRRVFRGGSWDNAESNCRSSHRDSIGEGSRTNYIGFRLIKEI